MGFSKKIKEFFDSKGLKQRDVSKIMDDYNEQMVSRYMNSDEISSTFIKKIAKYFPDADIDYLVRDDDDTIHIMNEPGDSYNTEAVQLVMEIEEKLTKLKEILARKSHDKI
ncbi:helix-turn-helix transcriptional regulator [Flavobacterium granuli]|uniref:Transcriptional regulator with XRE-family HTH domain n=1 Tax=Flavobacterium granuli TaxID=280093 RepID=A0ABU1S0B5_9FLAO|nr:helix-turn-helix transcriptional regulator [Flavobacterium granuli]MDR6844473.1 transcriptional regulator with XRE-family HTH domain [Flavobacterium granuli]